ncbi:metallophosphoesterase [Flavobacterium limnosediminis]|nr:metallophosphoesterase [Flavobacterium limnosediminis]
MKTFIVGDIHGCYDEFVELINKAKIEKEDFILSLGDIVDRGAMSKEVYHFFKNRPNSKVLMGNHERKHINNILSYAQEIVKVQLGHEYDEFVDWLKKLDYYYETDDAIIVHAAFEHDRDLYAQREDVLSGSTSGERYLEKKYVPETYWSEYYKGDKPIIYGHHVVGDNVKIVGNTYGIDTGACHGGYLTAIELPGFIIHQVKSKKDYWEEEQKKWQIEVLKSKPWMTMNFEAINNLLDKLSYISDPRVIDYLKDTKNRIEKFDDLLALIKLKIEQVVKEILETEDVDFSKEANKYSFSRFLFMSRSNKLNIKDLEKVFDTPESRIDMGRELGIDTDYLEMIG